MSNVTLHDLHAILGFIFCIEGEGTVLHLSEHLEVQ